MCLAWAVSTLQIIPGFGFLLLILYKKKKNNCSKFCTVFKLNNFKFLKKNYKK